jgi:hypothetical protein
MYRLHAYVVSLNVQHFSFMSTFRDGTIEVASENLDECLSVTSKFAWGSYDNNTALVTFVGAASCSDWVEEVDVDLTLQWPSLRLDPTNPPRPDESTSRVSPRFVAPPYIQVYAGGGPELLFNINSSRYGLPTAALGQPDRQQAVFAATVDYWNRWKARGLDSNGFRKGFNETVTVPNVSTLDAGSYKYTLNGPFSETQPAPRNATLSGATVRRLVQNERPTYFLLSLLAALLLLNLASFALLPRRIVPKNPRSVAAMASLLADSNVFARLGTGPGWMPTSEVEALFRGERFVMGWLGDGLYAIGLASSEKDGRGPLLAGARPG